MYRIVGVGIAALLLVGCAQERQHPIPLTDAERLAFENEWEDQLWAQYGQDDAARPMVIREHVPRALRGPAEYQCMLDLGFNSSRYSVSNGRLNVNSPPPDGPEAVALFACQARFVPEPAERGYYSASELNFAYDYMQDWLVPCLTDAGHPEPKGLPRADVAAGPGLLLWNPYDEVGPLMTQEQRDAVILRCPPLPEYFDWNPIDYGAAAE